MQVRTQTLVKNAIIQIDATPFRQWYQQHYGIEVGLKKKLGASNAPGDEKQVSLVACPSSACLPVYCCYRQWHVIQHCQGQ